MDLKEFSLDLRKFHWIQENHGWEGKEPVHTEAVAVWLRHDFHLQHLCFFGDDVEEDNNDNDYAGGGGENDCDGGDDVVECNNGGRSDISPLA